MKVTKSKFDSSLKIVHVDADDEQYKKLKKLFDIHGFAFLTQSVIFLNKPELLNQNLYKSNYLTFIESHEVAHQVLKHNSLKRNPVHEAEADYLGVMLCLDKNFKSAANVGKKYFTQRNSISFEKYQNKYGEKILSKVVNKN
jgi:hypothetical protein